MATDIALFIHLLGVVLLFVAIGISQVGGSMMRSATTIDQVRTWSGLVESSGRTFPIAFLMILGAGIYMANDTWGFDRPFVVVGPRHRRRDVARRRARHRPELRGHRPSR